MRDGSLLVGLAILEHMRAPSPDNENRRSFAEWPGLLGAESLQQCAMECLRPAASIQSKPLEHIACNSQHFTDAIIRFLGDASHAGKLSNGRQNALVGHEAVFEPLRAVAQGCKSFYSIDSSLRSTI